MYSIAAKQKFYEYLFHAQFAEIFIDVVYRINSSGLDILEGFFESGLFAFA